MSGAREVRLQTDAGSNVVQRHRHQWHPGMVHVGAEPHCDLGLRRPDPRFRMNGAGALSLDAVSLFFYETQL